MTQSGEKMFSWDSIYTVEFSFLVKVNFFPTILVPKGYVDDGHTGIPDWHEPKKTGLPEAVIAHVHDFGYQHRRLADGAEMNTNAKGFWDQLYKEMFDASNRWIKRGISGTLLRGLRYFAGPAWDARKEPDPLKPEWEHLFGVTKSAMDARLRMPIVRVHYNTGRLVMDPPERID